MLSSAPVMLMDLREPPLRVHGRGCNFRDSLVHANVKSDKNSTQAMLKPSAKDCYKYTVCAPCNNVER